MLLLDGAQGEIEEDVPGLEERVDGDEVGGIVSVGVALVEVEHLLGLIGDDHEAYLGETPLLPVGQLRPMIESAHGAQVRGNLVGLGLGRDGHHEALRHLERRHLAGGDLRGWLFILVAAVTAHQQRGTQADST